MVSDSLACRPLVSVLMAVRNEREDYLQTAIDSILAQSLVDFEFVIVDDGSTEQGTLQCLARAAAADSRIRLCTHLGEGLTKALNVGLAECLGQFVCRQDSDDWSDPRRLELQTQFLSKHPNLAVVGSNILLHRANGTPLWSSRLPCKRDDIAAELWRRNPFAHGSICFRREAALRVGAYNPWFRYAQDYDFIWRLCDYAGGANLPLVLYHLRRTGGSVSARFGAEQASANHVTRELAAQRARGAAFDLSRAIEQANAVGRPKPRKSVGSLKKADELLLAGHTTRALMEYLVAIRVDPSCWRTYVKLLRLPLFEFVPFLRRPLFERRLGRRVAEQHG